VDVELAGSKLLADFDLLLQGHLLVSKENHATLPNEQLQGPNLLVVEFRQLYPMYFRSQGPCDVAAGASCGFQDRRKLRWHIEKVPLGRRRRQVVREMVRKIGSMSGRLEA
jgi:hypothetical protein